MTSLYDGESHLHLWMYFAHLEENFRYLFD